MGYKTRVGKSLDWQNRAGPVVNVLRARTWHTARGFTAEHVPQTLSQLAEQIGCWRLGPARSQFRRPTPTVHASGYISVVPQCPGVQDDLLPRRISSGVVSHLAFGTTLQFSGAELPGSTIATVCLDRQIFYTPFAAASPGRPRRDLVV